MHFSCFLHLGFICYRRSAFNLENTLASPIPPPSWGFRSVPLEGFFLSSRAETGVFSSVSLFSAVDATLYVANTTRIRLVLILLVTTTDSRGCLGGHRDLECYPVQSASVQEGSKSTPLSSSVSTPTQLRRQPRFFATSATEAGGDCEEGRKRETPDIRQGEESSKLVTW